MSSYKTNNSSYRKKRNYRISLPTIIEEDESSPELFENNNYSIKYRMFFPKPVAGAYFHEKYKLLFVIFRISPFVSVFKYYEKEDTTVKLEFDRSENLGPLVDPYDISGLDDLVIVSEKVSSVYIYSIKKPENSKLREISILTNQYDCMNKMNLRRVRLSNELEMNWQDLKVKKELRREDLSLVLIKRFETRESGLLLSTYKSETKKFLVVTCTRRQKVIIFDLLNMIFFTGFSINNYEKLYHAILIEDNLLMTSQSGFLTEICFYNIFGSFLTRIPFSINLDFVYNPVLYMNSQTCLVEGEKRKRNGAFMLFSGVNRLLLWQGLDFQRQVVEEERLLWKKYSCYLEKFCYSKTAIFCVSLYKSSLSVLKCNAC